MSSSGETRISRWSRLKTSQRDERSKYRAVAATADINDGVIGGNTLETQSMASLTDENLPVEVSEEPEPDIDAMAEELKLPKVDDLTADSDFTAFMEGSVPEALKKAAMRKLWLSNPLFANLDGLNDYDHDYNVIDKLISALDTNYQVGKGMLGTFEEEDEAKTKAEEGEIEQPESTESLTENDLSSEQVEEDRVLSDAGDEETDLEEKADI